MDREQRRAGVERHQHPAIFINKKRKFIARGTMFQVLEQIAQLTGHHAANENAHKAASPILYRHQHLDVGSYVGRPALGSGFSDAVGEVRQIGYLDRTERAVERLLKFALRIIEKDEQRLAYIPTVRRSEHRSLCVREHDFIEIGK